MKVKILTYGCTANKCDSETIMNLLSKEFKVVKNGKADITIIGTCGVKGNTEEKIVSKIRRTKGKVIIAGCLPKISRKRLENEFPQHSMIGPDQVLDIVSIVKKVAKGKRVIETRAKKCDRIIKKDIRIDDKTEIISIAQGCLGKCTYCAAKLARGELYSYPASMIIDRVKEAVSNGVKKIMITAQDAGAYGVDIGTNLPNLLKKIVKVPGRFKVRIGMMNPEHVNRFLPELIDVYKNSKIIKFLHIPVQSGSDLILSSMGRRYLVKDFKKVAKEFRKSIPNICISTDIICGFPGELDSQFKDTIKLINWLKPEVLNISKFYPRPGTYAKDMPQLPTHLIKKRSKALTDVFKRIKSKGI